MKCGNQVAVKGAAPVMREITAVATTTADIICGACTVGTFPSSATGACTACTAVAGAKADATYQCNSASDSRVNNCLACAAKTVGAAGAPDTCTAACAAGSYRANSGDCTACSIANADATVGAVTYTCTSNADVRFATSGCAATHYKVAGTNADSCAPVTACSSNQATGACFPRVQVDAPTATTDRTCTPCAAGTFAANGQTDCQAQTTCGKQVGGASRLTGQSTIAAGTCAPCTDGTFAATGATDCSACTPVANGVGLTCTSATTSRVTACAATYGWTSGGAGHDTCVAACPCGKWAKP